MLRKFLISLSDEKIAQIALNLGCIAASRKNQEDFIMEQAKTYRWNIADFRSRYNITSQITVKIGCNGLGANPPYSKEVEVELLNNTPVIPIKITVPAYTRLVNWASLGRTFDLVFHALEQLPENNTEDAIEELLDVKDALIECHEAARKHWSNISNKSDL